MDTALKTGLVPLNTPSKKVVHMAAEATAGFIGNITTYKKVKPKPVPDENSRNVEEIVKSSREKRRNIEQIKASIIK